MAQNLQVPLLRLSGIGKSFSGTRVLHQIAFEVLPGEVHAVMGENGAGKSTLMKILAGIHLPDAGSMKLNGQEVKFLSPSDALKSGISIIHQELNVVPEMSIADNLALGNEPRTRLGLLDRGKVEIQAREKLARVQSNLDPLQSMGSLSIGMQQIVEIARAIAQDSRILILDEPTAALSTSESSQLFELILKMRSNGMGLIYISHRMQEVWELADRITVLRDGCLVSTSNRVDTSQHIVVNDMIGRDIESLFLRDERKIVPGGLLVSGLGDGKRIGPVSFEVRSGEVVGLFGLVGAGRSEIARLIFGADRVRLGSVSVDGSRVIITDPASAIAAGIGLLSEDRKGQGLLLNRDVIDNVALPSFGSFQRFGILKFGRIRSAVRAVSDRLKIKSSSDSQLVSELSGGNQQKVLVARWLEVKPRVLIMDEPTRGVDIGSKAQIYRTINELASEGTAVLIISSDISEVLGISDRIIVVRDGLLSGEFNGLLATEEALMLSATGIEKPNSESGAEPQKRSRT
jgi:ribose transport system ATP-binding protein